MTLQRMMRVNAFVLIYTVARACPDVIDLEFELSGKVETLRFDRRASLHGIAYGHALATRLLGGGCVTALCVADLLAFNARAAFAAAGCADDDYSPQRFDVVQVGAHVGDSRAADGRALDPLFGWLRHDAPSSVRALLIEPMRASFEQLVANYAGARADLTYAMVAVDPAADPAGAAAAARPPGPRAMYAIEHTADDASGASAGLRGMPRFEGGAGVAVRGLDMLASFDAAHLERHLALYESWGAARGAARVVARSVAAFGWAALLQAHGARAVGQLVLDAEGFDCELVRAYPFGAGGGALRPRVVQFEHKHCDGAFSAGGGARPNFDATVALLRTHGYRSVTADDPDDIVFVLGEGAPLARIEL
jgi:hypothetical protein